MSRTAILVDASENRDLRGNAIDKAKPVGDFIELTLQIVDKLGFAENVFHSTKARASNNKKKWNHVQFVGLNKKGTWARSEYKPTDSIIYGEKRAKTGFNQFRNRKSSNILAISAVSNDTNRIALAQKVNNVDNWLLTNFPNVI